MDSFFSDVWRYMTSLYNDFVQLTPRVVLAILLFTGFYLLSRLLRRWSAKRIEHRTSDLLLAGFLGQTVQFFVIMGGFITALYIIGLGNAAGSILAGAGITAFVIGFAFKDIGENLLAGLMLAFSRPFNLGDTIRSEGNEGKVVGLNFRQTIIKTVDGYDIFLPNSSILKSPLINANIDTNLRADFEVKTFLTADIADKMEEIQTAILEIPGVLHDPAPQVRVRQHDFVQIALKVQYWTDTADGRYGRIDIENTATIKAMEILKTEL